jgi:acetate kinase
MVEMGGVDAIVFTGGIGENRPEFRAMVCRDLEGFGIELDPAINGDARGEGRISAETSRTEIWVVPTNEELIVARQAKAFLEG